MCYNELIIEKSVENIQKNIVKNVKLELNPNNVDQRSKIVFKNKINTRII